MVQLDARTDEEAEGNAVILDAFFLLPNRLPPPTSLLSLSSSKSLQLCPGPGGTDERNRQIACNRACASFDCKSHACAQLHHYYFNYTSNGNVVCVCVCVHMTSCTPGHASV